MKGVQNLRLKLRVQGSSVRFSFSISGWRVKVKVGMFSLI